jgi:hypothetical protein
VSGDAGNPASKGSIRSSMPAHVMRFALYSGILLLVAWVAGTGRVAYTMIMILIAAALGFAIVDSVGYRIVKRERRG